MGRDASSNAPSAGVTLRSVMLGHEGFIDDLAWSPDGGFLATGSRDGTARLWRVVDGAEVAVLPPGGQGRAVTCVSCSPDAEVLATVAGDGTVRLWSLPEGMPGATFQAPSPRYVRWIGWTRDGRNLVAWIGMGWRGTTDEAFYLTWDRTGEGGNLPLARPDVRTTPLPFELVARQGSWPWVPRGRDWPIRADGVPLVPMTGSTTIYTAALSPDGGTLAYEMPFGVRLWDVARRRVRRPLKGHSGWVFGLAWSPDGRLLASRSVDGTVRLWATGRRRQVATLPAPSLQPMWGGLPGQARPVFHPFRSDLLATVADTDHEQAVKIWQLDPALLPPAPKTRLRLR